MITLLFALSASAVDLSIVSTDTPWNGVTITEYRTSNPTTDTWVAEIDLCQASIHVDASDAPGSRQTAGSLGAELGAQLVVNGDFYRTGPLRVYGRAVGEGIAWPLDHTGADPGYAYEWFYQRYGWIAVGHDRVEFDHTKWVKNNVTTSAGYSAAVADAPPVGTLALVSGFPELVTEGSVVTCSSPTSGDCFPDRTDMRTRHPRSAMGISEDRQTLILAVVDGRSSRSSGMYGAELADLMGQVGAWQAFNLDGGGSTQMWQQGDGYLNNPSDGSARPVANHWAIFAGNGHDKPNRPGHCEIEAPCGVVPAEGGVIDDADTCFRTFGPQQYWREEAVGNGGHLFWTNAWENETASDWAWWQIHTAEAGEYLVEYYAEPSFALFDAVDYRVVADGVETKLTVDQSQGNGWTELGTFDFAAGGDQFVALYDNAVNAVPSGQHIAADAIRLTRLDMPEPDDTDVPDDTGTDWSDTGDSEVEPDGDTAAFSGTGAELPQLRGCESAWGARPGIALWMLLALAIRRRVD